MWPDEIYLFFGTWIKIMNSAFKDGVFQAGDVTWGSKDY